jgi:[acyl-carrier-protein] S-malonyltransferase
MQVRLLHYNAIGQIVISGDAKGVEQAMVKAKELGAKLAKLLPLSVPSHSPLMQPAAVELAKKLENTAIQTPKFTILHNVNVASANHPDDIRELLVKQLYSPVRWVETIQQIVVDGCHDMVECGPGNVLTGLNKRIDKSITMVAIESGAITAE